MMHGANNTMRTLGGTADTVCGAANMMGVAADTMHGAADMMAQWVRPPPYMEKNKLILNEYLGIFMHFESIFFFFLIWKMEFFRPTHPLNLENSRFFFKPSLMTT